MLSTTPALFYTTTTTEQPIVKTGELKDKDSKWKHWTTLSYRQLKASYPDKNFLNSMFFQKEDRKYTPLLKGTFGKYFSNAVLLAK